LGLLELADEHAGRDRNAPQRSRSTQNRLKENRVAEVSSQFWLARSAPSVARFSPATIMLTFSGLIITQTKTLLSKRSKSITDAAARLQRE
jgi:hypothetical protein